MRALIYPKNSRLPQVVHMRDTLMAEPDALQFSRPALNVASSTTVQQTLDHMRARNEQMIIVGKPNNKPGAQAVWILTWNNIMGQLAAQITEELDKGPYSHPKSAQLSAARCNRETRTSTTYGSSELRADFDIAFEAGRLFHSISRPDWPACG